MPKILQVHDFLGMMQCTTVIDVRTPAEFESGHIPNAVNLPLFTNEERVVVGTIYKQQGREPAIIKGLEFVGCKMADIVKQAIKVAPSKKILVHCWRGGMRSSSVAWLLETCGFITYTLQGGYKAYRKFIRSEFTRPAKVLVLGGMTGSGKTEILHQLKKLGEQIIDLEAIARHKGSAFGALGEEKQPSNENCENLIYQAWSKLNQEKIIWIEDESQRIGNINLCDEFFNQIRNAKVMNILVDKNIRIERLVADYGKFSKDELSDAIQRIKKRLGGMETQQCLQAIQNEDYALVADISLRYYDKTYNYGLSQREPGKVHTLEIHENNPEQSAKKIIEIAKKINW